MHGDSTLPPTGGYPPIDAYRVLQVDPQALNDVVRAAYRVLARHYHPDRWQDPAAHNRMAMINRAYELVSTPARRAAYDAARSSKVERSGPEVMTQSPTPKEAQPVIRSRYRRTSGSRLDFGRYRGWTLDELAEHDPAYLQWLTRHSGGVRYRREIEQILAASHRPTKR